MHRDDFAMLSNNIVYFDNGATTLKPKCVRDAICKYYDEYTANAHRGDYKTSAIVDNLYESTREEIKNFINAKENSEIVFTSGTTNGMNMIVTGFFKNYLYLRHFTGRTSRTSLSQTVVIVPANLCSSLIISWGRWIL